MYYVRGGECGRRELPAREAIRVSFFFSFCVIELYSAIVYDAVYIAFEKYIRPFRALAAYKSFSFFSSSSFIIAFVRSAFQSDNAVMGSCIYELIK